MKKTVFVRNVPIGGENRVTVQSMTNTLTSDIVATENQIIALKKAGADLVRISIPNLESAENVRYFSSLGVPLIGDIHFDYTLALKAIENGIDKIRINPSNMPKKGLIEVVKLCKERKIPIRIGVNQGSMKESATVERLVALTLDSVKSIEDMGFYDLVLAVKSSNVRKTVEAYRLLSQKTDYPLHIGLTEAGTREVGIVKSSIAIGSLLLDGIGDTIRVSLTGNPVYEVEEGRKILRAVGLEKSGVEIISCPTCARKEINVEGIATQLSLLTKSVEKYIKVAVMGCVVNGIGESKDAKLGVAGSKGKGVIFVDGKVVETVENEYILTNLYNRIMEITNE